MYGAGYWMMASATASGRVRVGTCPVSGRTISFAPGTRSAISSAAERGLVGNPVEFTVYHHRWHCEFGQAGTDINRVERFHQDSSAFPASTSDDVRKPPLETSCSVPATLGVGLLASCLSAGVLAGVWLDMGRSWILCGTNAVSAAIHR